MSKLKIQPLAVIHSGQQLFHGLVYEWVLHCHHHTGLYCLWDGDIPGHGRHSDGLQRLSEQLRRGAVPCWLVFWPNHHACVRRLWGWGIPGCVRKSDGL